MSSRVSCPLGQPARGRIEGNARPLGFITAGSTRITIERMSTQLHPSDSVEIPDLRIVALHTLVEHEYNDDQRTAPLARRLQAEGILKNPPIVAPLGDDDPRFVVLDGANRTTALQSLGYSHALVQVVKYGPPDVVLTTWHHLVTGMDPGEFIARLGTVDGVRLRPTDLLHARAGLARREVLLYVIRADGQAFVASTETPRRTVHEQNRLLNALVDTYKTRGQIHRAMADNDEEARRLFSDLAGLVVFPNYDIAEVLTLARDGELLPTGLTRHLIHGRALRINYPLDELQSSDSLEEKNARLRDWMRNKLASKEVRYYGERTFSFDE